jgi:hypothetical protein
MIRRYSETATTVALLLIFAAYLWQSAGYNANARLIPYIVGTGAIVVAIIQLIGPHIGFLKPLIFGKADTAPAESRVPDPRRVLAIIFWTIALTVMIYLVGFIVAVPVMLITLFIAVERTISKNSIIITTGLTILSWFFTIHVTNFRWHDWYLWKVLGM